MEGTKQESQKQKQGKIIPLNPEEKKRLLEEPRQRIQVIIDRHDAWQLDSLRSVLRL